MSRVLGISDTIADAIVLQAGVVAIVEASNVRAFRLVLELSRLEAVESWYISDDDPTTEASGDGYDAFNDESSLVEEEEMTPVERELEPQGCGRVNPEDQALARDCHLRNIRALHPRVCVLSKRPEHRVRCGR